MIRSVNVTAEVAQRGLLQTTDYRPGDRVYKVRRMTVDNEAPCEYLFTVVTPTDAAGRVLVQLPTGEYRVRLTSNIDGYVQRNAFQVVFAQMALLAETEIEQAKTAGAVAAFERGLASVSDAALENSRRQTAHRFAQERDDMRDAQIRKEA